MRVTYSADQPGESCQVDEEFHVGIDDEIYHTTSSIEEAIDYAIDQYIKEGLDLQVYLVTTHYDAFGDVLAVTKEEVGDDLS